VTPEPADPSPKFQVNVALLGTDAVALKNTSELMPGVVGENVKFATTCAEVADTLTVRELAYRCVTVIPAAVPPSPKSQLKVPPVTVDVEALKKTSWLTAGTVGEIVNCAACGGKVVDTVIVRDAVDTTPVSLVTVSVTVKVFARGYWWVTATPEPVVPSPKSQA
jgi:hypothetical protein